MTLGTPQYMSPEQAAGRTLDGRSDLYSLGVMIYEMLIGVVPFDDPSTPALLVKHLNTMPDRPSIRRPDVVVSPELEAIALRNLEKDPEARFQSADEVSVALDAFMASASTGGIPVPSAFAWSNRSGAGETTLPMGAAGPEPPAPTPPTVIRPSAPATAIAGRALAPDAPTAGADSRAGSASVPPAIAPLAAAGVVAAGAAPAPDAVTRPSRSTGSSMIPVVVLLLVIGGVGFGGYGMGYWSTPASDPTMDPETIAGGPAPVLPPPTTEDSAATPGTSPAANAGEPTQAGTSGPSVPSGEPSSPPVAPGRSATPPPSARSQPATPQTQAATVVAPPPAPQQAQAPPDPPRPEHPSVRFGCDGPAEICIALQSAVDQALGTASMPSVMDETDAELLVDAIVVAGTPRSQQMFDTVMVIKPYTVSFSGADRRTRARMPMPSPTSFTLDERVGQARVAEQSRVMSAGVVKQLKAYWASKR
jgi:hypothetical protein